EAEAAVAEQSSIPDLCSSWSLVYLPTIRPATDSYPESIPYLRWAGRVARCPLADHPFKSPAGFSQATIPAAAHPATAALSCSTVGNSPLPASASRTPPPPMASRPAATAAPSPCRARGQRPSPIAHLRGTARVPLQGRPEAIWPEMAAPSSRPDGFR